MRFLVLLLLVTACPAKSQDAIAPNAFPGDAAGGLAPGVACVEDTDCALSGATCCACPSFAVAANDPGLKTCAAVNCPMMDCPQNLRAACTRGTCQLACAAVACSTSCATGYAADANGCLTCDCLQPGPEACVRDQDCVDVKADCCGCALGGSDIAILASQAAAYGASLGCPQSPQCPNQNVCEPGAVAHCSQGGCVLEAPRPLPANACGRPDLPACPAGQTCVVNANADADAQGVGVCTPP